MIRNHPHKRDEEWDKTGEGIMLNFAESGHPVFRATRRRIEKQGKGNQFIHFNGGDETIELILRTLIFVSQLSMYGAAADLCKELARDSSAGKPAADESLGSMVIPTEFLTACTVSQTDADVQGNLLRETSRNSQNPEQQKLTKLCSNAGFSKNTDKRQFFITPDEEGT